MYRQRLIVAIVCIVASSYLAAPLCAQGAAIAPVSGFWIELAGTGGSNLQKLIARTIGRGRGTRVAEPDIGTSSGVLAGYTIGGKADGSIPPVAIVAAVSVAEPSLWQEAAWLAILERLIDDPPPAGAFLFIVDGDKTRASSLPGDTSLRGQGLQQALLDAGVGAVLVLDILGSPREATVSAESEGRLSPRAVLETARRAASSAAFHIEESPVSAFYAALGLRAGSAALTPWLASGLPAIAVRSVDTRAPVYSSGDDEASFLEFVVGFVSAADGGALRREPRYQADVNYLRYPLPVGVITIGDTAIVFLYIGTAAFVGVFYALGLFGRRGRLGLARPSGKGALAVSREAAMAILISLAAIVGAKALVDLGHIVAKAISGVALPAVAYSNPSAWLMALVMVFRICGALSVFYAISGIASMLGLHGEHGRVEALQASLAILCLDALVAVAVAPIVAPFFLFAVILVVLAAGSAAAAGLGLIAAVAVIVPFLDPRIISGDVASRALDSGIKGMMALAMIAAPFGIWLGVATSPAHVMRRGRRTAVLWVIAAIASAAGEVMMRLAWG